MGGGKSGGGGGAQTVQQNADPWSGQQPYLREMFSEAQKLYRNGGMAPGYYSGQTVASQDPHTNQAVAMQANRALAGSDAVRSAQSQLASTMKGDYLANNPFSTDAANPFADAANPFMNTGGNPQLEAMVRRAQGQALAGVNGNFAQAGRYGSGAHAAAAGDAAGNIATQMYGQAYDQDQSRALSAWEANQARNYNAWNENLNRASVAWNTERDNQMKGMMFAPSLAAEDYKDIAALSEAGVARENYAQNLINADIDRYNYNAARGLSALQQYASLIQGNYGMSGSSATTSGVGRSNPLGGALSGAGIGASVGGPMGALIGGLGGGLLSLF